MFEIAQTLIPPILFLGHSPCQTIPQMSPLELLAHQKLLVWFVGICILTLHVYLFVLNKTATERVPSKNKGKKDLTKTLFSCMCAHCSRLNVVFKPCLKKQS